MKKFISCALVVCMVVAMVAMIPMTASAEFVAGVNALTNTSQTFDTSSTTGLDAYYGSPKVGGETGTIKDDAWNGAYKLTLDDNTKIHFVNGTLAALANRKVDVDVWLMWDENNFYILEYVKTTTLDTNDTLNTLKSANPPAPYSGYQTVLYNILLPREISGNTDSAEYQCAASYMVYTAPLLKEKGGVTAIDEANSGKIFEGASFIRENEYRSQTGNTTKPGMISYDILYEEGMRTYVETKADGYMTETKIPWSILDSTFGDTFVPSEGVTIGMKIYPGSTYHFGNAGGKLNDSSSTLNGDTMGYDPVTLCAAADSKNTNYDHFVPKIAADLDYWIGADGLFTKKDGEGEFLYKKGGQTYEIYTAAQFMGLANILEAGTGDHSLTAVGIESANREDKALLSRGNTFKLMNDIDFNPGVDWAKANDFLVKKNSGAACDFAKIGSPLPVNVFVGLDRFYGTLDGQGYSIKGLYNPDTETVSRRSAGITPANGGLIGQLSQGGLVDLVVESGYVGTSVLKDNVMFGGLIGEIRPEKYTDFTNGEIILSNIYVGSDFTAHRYGIATDINAYAYAGVASSVWAGTKSVITDEVAIKATYADIVFSGKLLDNPDNVKSIGLKDGKYLTYYEDLVLGNNFKTGKGTWKANNVTFNYTYSDIVANVPETADANQNTGTIYTKVTIGGEVPAGLVKMTDGTAAPVKVADMLADTKWQASAAADGRFYVRFVSEVEIADMNDYEAIGHKITITGKKAGQDDITVEVDLTDNTNVYAGIKADGVTVTADSDKFNVIDGNYLVASIINLPAIDGVTYTATVQTIYKVSETVTITGCAEDLGAIAPLN